MKILKRVWLLAILLISCQDLAVEEHIVGNYYIIATDSENEKCLSYATKTGAYICITPSSTFSVAYNTKYVVAKQHPIMEENEKNSITNYYIHERQNVKPELFKNIVEGPLYEEVFEGKKKQLEKYGMLEFRDVD
ncbi:hypothetical protein [Spirosoma jeollabukense]